MKKSFFAFLATVGLAFSCSMSIAEEEETSFGIGSDAPAIDVEHWIQDGNGFFKPVTEFEDGKVYVVEFWATWCGPCIASMPHLAEVQNKYRGQGVQIVSISDEKLDVVEKFLDGQAAGGKGEEAADAEPNTYRQVTAAYCLTTDPDRSVFEDYMEASGQNGIPTSFIVGKDGKVEWIGHPMRMDEPLEKVVAGDWDREAYKQEYEEQNRFQKVMQKVSMLAGAQKFDEAIEVIAQEVSAAKSPEMKEQLEMLLYNLKLSAGKIDDEVAAYFRGQLASMKGDTIAVGRFGYAIFSAMQNGVDVGGLAGDAITALEAEVSEAPDQYKPFVYNQLAQLYDATDKLADAIAAQEKAVAASEGRAQKRMQLYLEELKEKSKDDSAAPAEEAEAK